MTTPIILADEIINKLSTTGDYELTRSKTKYEKQKQDNERLLAKLEQEERDLKSSAFDLLDNPDALETAKEKIKSKSHEIEQARLDRDTFKIVLNRIDKLLEEIVTKKNHEQILKYLKSLGYTTLEQVKAALSKNH